MTHALAIPLQVSASLPGADTSPRCQCCGTALELTSEINALMCLPCFRLGQKAIEMGRA